MKKLVTAAAALAVIAASFTATAQAAPGNIGHTKSAQRGTPSVLTDPEKIATLAQEAYIWALAPEFVYRFYYYNTLKTGPVNKLVGLGNAASWDNAATNAGDASVLYLNSMIDLSGDADQGGTKELVLTVPPSQDEYYVVDFLDQYINTVGSIGTRTTPSTKKQTYLIAGPTSKYAHDRNVTINGKSFRVLPTDTNLNWMLIRILGDVLAPASAENSTANIFKNVVQKFAMNPLKQYQKNGNKPIYQSNFQYDMSATQKEAQQWHSQPTNAVEFFTQAGESLVMSPLPDKTTGLGDTPLAQLPAWISPQADATTTYQNPSWGQDVLELFAPLGLTQDGYAVPSNWGYAQLNALQAGMDAGQAAVNTELNSNAGASTNFWKYLNNSVGTYPNTYTGYLYRATIVLAGGSANLPLDALYAQSNNIANSTTQLNGNNTYSVTFTPPTGKVPENGTIPPMVNNADGNPKGFWSMHVYQPDATQSAAPFLMQSSVLNRAYSKANLKIISVNASKDTLTVKNTKWSKLEAAAPVFFSKSAYGLKANTAYFLTKDPKVSSNGKQLTITVAKKWKQSISSGKVPIQASGKATKAVDLKSASGTISMKWGPIQSVSQLGSQQIEDGMMKKNADGSITIWVGPTLPAGADPHNWIPTASTGYYNGIYGSGSNVNTDIRLMMRMYYPAPGWPGPSVLPLTNPNTGVTEAASSYQFPLVTLVK